MMITEERFRRVEGCFPKQRGNVAVSNLGVLNAIRYLAEHGCRRRGLPKRLGLAHHLLAPWPLDQDRGARSSVFTALQEEEVIRIKVETLSLDGTIVKVHPDGTGAES